MKKFRTNFWRINFFKSFLFKYIDCVLIAIKFDTEYKLKIYIILQMNLDNNIDSDEF